MKKITRILLFFTAFIPVLLTSCVSWTLSGEFDLDSNPQLESLRFYDHYENKNGFNKYRQKAGLQLKQSMMRSGHSDYGYFCYVSEDKYYQDTDTIFFATLLFPLILWGLPTDKVILTEKFDLYIFDSNGEFIQKFTGENTKMLLAGLYYGHNWNAEKVRSKAINEIITDIPYRASDINKKLVASGPNSEEKEKEALKKIDDYFSPQTKKVTSSSSSTQSYSSPNVSNPAPASASIQPQPSAASLKNGTYTCSGSNLKMSLNYGFATLSEGYNLVASGSYKIQGNRLLITWTSVTSEAFNYLRNVTSVYIIQDDKAFKNANNGVMFVYTGF